MDNIIFIVIVEDRHIDVGVEPFWHKEEAIDKAKEFIAENNRSDIIEEQELNSTMVEEGWVYFATYSCEGNSVRVVERELK